MPLGISTLLEEARSHLDRISPSEAAQIQQDGGLLVDIRPHAQRVLEGEIPDAVVIERNVLEWRFDLQDRWHIPQVTSYEQPVVVICSEGYTSSLAARALQELGFHRATDVEGGFLAWKAAGLSIREGGSPAIP